MEEKIEEYYQNRAKELIDCMFDTKIFKDEITRDDMKSFEDLVAFNYQCFSNSNRMMANFRVKFKK